MTSDLPNMAGQDVLHRRVNTLFHDFQASQFDEIHRFRHQIEKQFWLSDVAPRLAGKKHLLGVDLCTGTGFVAGLLLERLDRSSRICCCDLSEEALRRAQSSLAAFAGRVSLQAADVQALPLPDSCADWVSLNAGLHHVPGPENTLREIRRLLKPGGYFCLGYEPNAAFFSSQVLCQIERVIWHAFWYLSPKRNWQRAKRRLCRHAVQQDHEHLEHINQCLLREGLIPRPLSLPELRGMVDVHSHSEQEHKVGFDPEAMLWQHFPEYTVECLRFTDYGGEMLRAHSWIRWICDGIGRASAAGKGQLFSWVIRKPPQAAACKEVAR